MENVGNVIDIQKVKAFKILACGKVAATYISFTKSNLSSKAKR